MDFALTPEQDAVRDLAARILTERTTPERLAALEGWFDRDTWSALADAGLLGIALPEDVGGAGLGPVALYLLLEQVGAAAAPVPVWESLVLGAATVDAHRDPGGPGDGEVRQRVLPEVAAGRVVVTAALHDEEPAEPREPRTVAEGDGDALRLTGVKTAVPAGAIADLVVVPATTPEGRVVVGLLDPSAAGVTLEPQRATDGSPTARLVLDGAPLVAVLGDAAALDDLLTRAAVGLAAVQIGIADAALRLSATYTGQRQQFGRPIATFQAVAHRVADAYIDVQAARLTGLAAAWRLEAGLPANEQVAIAQWWAGEATHRVLHAAHHVHGGVGVDRDYPLHRYFLLGKRLEFALGGAEPHLRRLGAALAAAV